MANQKSANLANVKKQLDAIFSKKSSTAKPPRKPDAIMPKQKQEKFAELPKTDLEMIQKSDFGNQAMLFVAISLGKKIASDPKNRSWLFSEFKRDITGWLKDYGKLKPEDFDKKSKKWTSLINTIIKDAEHYKKVVITDENGKTRVAYKDSAKYAENRYLRQGIKKKLSKLSDDQIRFLDIHGVFTDRKKIENIRVLLQNLLKSKSEKESANELIDIYTRSSLEDTAAVYEALSTLSDSELHYFPEFISNVRYDIDYNSLRQYLIFNPYNPDASDWYDYGDKKHKPLDERKVAYMSAMKETAEKSLKTGIVQH